MAKDTLEALLERLRAKEGAPVPTSALGRLRRTAAAGAISEVAGEGSSSRHAQTYLELRLEWVLGPDQAWHFHELA